MDNRALIAEPSNVNFLISLGGSGAAFGSYFAAGIIVNTFILPATDHIVLCIVLALWTTLTLFVLYEGLRRAYEWADHNEWFRGLAYMVFFLLTLGIMVIFQLITAFLTSEFWSVTPEGRWSLFAVFSLIVLLLLQVLWRTSIIVFLKGLPPTATTTATRT